MISVFPSNAWMILLPSFFFLLHFSFFLFFKVFEACAELDDSIIFLDEVDALATSRDNDQMHEASRRVLSVLLRKVRTV